jgi:hypothetical protein
VEVEVDGCIETENKLTSGIKTTVAAIVKNAYISTLNMNSLGVIEVRFFGFTRGDFCSVFVICLSRLGHEGTNRLF